MLPQALQGGVGLPKLVEILCDDGYNKRAKLHFLGPLLSNLTQLPEARGDMLSRDRCPSVPHRAAVSWSS